MNRTVSLDQQKPVELSKGAKSMIRSLVVANGKKRISIHKIKQHEFFQNVKWSDIDKAKFKMPKVNQREPDSGQFDLVDPDSCDEDWQHEYVELQTNDNDNSSSDSNQFSHLIETSAGQGAN